MRLLSSGESNRRTVRYPGWTNRYAVKANGIVEDDVGEHWYSIKHLTAEQRKEARNPDVIGNRPRRYHPDRIGMIFSLERR